MATSTISKVTPIRDAVDRLEWDVRVALSGFGPTTQGVYVLRCDGRIAFYRERVAGMPGPTFPRRTLTARWTNTERPRLHVPGEAIFQFATDVPRDALDEVERFREGGPLFARFEGKLALVFQKSEGQADWLGDLVRVLGDFHRSSSFDVCTDHLALRDDWCEEILTALRPPGRHLVEVCVPSAEASCERGQRALEHLRNAQRAFDDGRYADVLRAAYVVLDELVPLHNVASPRYGAFGHDRLREQMSETRKLCNPERHRTRDQFDSAPPDRLLAQHVLTVTASSCGVVLRRE